MNVVTGASGFIGSHLVDALLERGEPVAAAVLPGDDLVWLEGKDVEIRELDLSTGEGVDAAVADATVVYHVAGITRNASDEAFVRINRDATVHLARRCLAVAPALQRFVFVSSSIAMGPSDPDRPHTEADAPHPVDPYGQSKREAEEGLRQLPGLPLVIVRPPAVYGPRDRSFLALFRLARSGLLPVVGSGRQKISFIYVEDLARGMIAASRAGAPAGDTYHLTTEDLDWADVSRALGAALGSRLVRVRLPAWLARAAGWLMERWADLTGRSTPINTRKIKQLLYPAWTCSGALARRVLGFRPAVRAKEGFALTLRWYTAHAWM